MIDDISKVEVEMWEPKDILPYPYNNKKHPEKHIELLVNSIKVQGLIEPLILDKHGVVISGHGRLLALKNLGVEKIPVRILRDVTENQANALRIAANKTVSNDYDTDMLSRELRVLAEEQIDLSYLGFDEKELSMLISDVGTIDQDSLVSDLNLAIEEHETGILETSEATGKDNILVQKAFGFKYFPLKDQIVITRFMAEIEEATGLEGPAALVQHMKTYLEAL